jgi:hypothetical protein
MFAAPAVHRIRRSRGSWLSKGALLPWAQFSASKFSARMTRCPTLHGFHTTGLRHLMCQQPVSEMSSVCNACRVRQPDRDRRRRHATIPTALPTTIQ